MLSNLVIVVALLLQVAPKEDGWNDADDAIRVGDLTVFVRFAGVQKIAVKSFGSVAASDKMYMLLKIGINNSSDVRKHDYKGWSTKTLDVDRELVATAIDEFDNSYKRIDFGSFAKVDGQIRDGDSIYPNRVIYDVLVFEQPINNAKELRILLPGAAIGEKSDLRIKIPLDRSRIDGILFEQSSKEGAEKKAERDRRTIKAALELEEKKKADATELARTKPERDEKAAAGKLSVAEQLRKAGKIDGYRKTLKELADKYPDTEAGKKAAKLLK